MSAGAIRLVRDAIVTALQAQTGAGERLAGVNVSTHHGDFDLEALTRYGKQAPHLVLAVLRFTPVRGGGTIIADTVFGLVALTDDRADVRRADACLDLADAATRALLPLFSGSASTTVSTPQDYQAVNEYSAALDKLGVAMWGMTWTQSIDLIDVDTSVPFNGVDVDYDLSTRPEGEDLGEVPEARDEIDLT